MSSVCFLVVHLESLVSSYIWRPRHCESAWLATEHLRSMPMPCPKRPRTSYPGVPPMWHLPRLPCTVSVTSFNHPHMASSSPQSNPPRIAIVTGAAQGIGEAIALRLADDGLDVAVADLPSKRVQLEGVASAIEAKGRRALVLVGDITVEEDVAAVVAKTVEELGGLDVMVANAGVFVSIPFVDMTVEELNRVLRVNVCGSMLCFQHAARQMIQQGRGGRIIGASSLGGKRGFPSATAYVASKFAVRGLAQCVATELWEHNITVNTYAPGVAATPMTSHPDDAKNGGTAATLFKNTGMPIDTKLVPVSEVAELVAYLAKPETSSVTGQCFSINNGLHMD